MSEQAELADKNMKCDYCDEGAVFKFRKHKIVSGKRGKFLTPTMQWVGGCVRHLDQAMRLAKGAINDGANRA